MAHCSETRQHSAGEVWARYLCLLNISVRSSPHHSGNTVICKIDAAPTDALSPSHLFLYDTGGRMPDWQILFEGQRLAMGPVPGCDQRRDVRFATRTLSR